MAGPWAIWTLRAIWISASPFRTITMREGRAQLQAGAGIVADSHPAAEYEETRDKAQALIQALHMANQGM
jgi:anthranilate synthase component 1